MYKFVVVWKDSLGLEIYDPFDDKDEAYDYMISKLSNGLWACLTEAGKPNSPKIKYLDKPYS
jgi:hypothetical protein